MPATDLDHQYSRSPLVSDSGISSEVPTSPPLSDGADSPFSLPSQDGKMEGSPVSYDRDSMLASPLGGGVEDLQLTDFMFDTSCMLDNDSLLMSLKDTDNIMVNMGRCSGLEKMHLFSHRVLYNIL